jgi:hypothetical protein
MRLRKAPGEQARLRRAAEKKDVRHG